MRKILNEELNRPSLEEFKGKDKIKVVIVLDNVRSAHNAGSVFRTADAFAVEKVFCCGITASPPNRELLKTSLGAEESVEWKYFSSTIEAIRELKNNGYKIIAIEQTDKSISLDKFPFHSDEKIALVFGNEVKGISDEILPLLDAAIEIPQFGTKHSFNISITVGIVLWEYMRQISQVRI